MTTTLRNPMLIHTIQDRLIALASHDSMWVQMMAQGALDGKTKQVVREIQEQARDNRELVAGMIGENLLKDIEIFELC